MQFTKALVGITAAGFMTLGLAANLQAADAPLPPQDVKAQTSEKLAAVEMKYPRPAYIGTPREIKNTTAETIKSRRGQVLLPEGTTNLALKKPVTSSDKEPIIGELKQVTDGDKEGTEGSWVELGPGLQWVQIDLGKASEIWGIVVWHYHAESRVYRDVVIQVSDDADFISDVKTVYNNDHDNSAGLGIGNEKEFYEFYEGKFILLDGVNGRYVRLYSKGNTSDDQNHYTEVEVYGRQK